MVPTMGGGVRCCNTAGTRKLANHGESLLTVITNFLVVNNVQLDGELPPRGQATKVRVAGSWRLGSPIGRRPVCAPKFRALLVTHPSTDRR